jgi:hypothetical protein
LLTRSDRVIHVVRSSTSDANRPGPAIHVLIATTSAIARAFCFFVTGSSSTMV